MKKSIIFVFAIVVFYSGNTFAQFIAEYLNNDADSNYIEYSPKILVIRMFTSTKYLNFEIADNALKERLIYKPNENQVLGIGFMYKWVGVNLGFTMPFMNSDDETYGKTKYLDLQSHIYLRKGTFDIYLQRYKGFYLENSGDMIVNWPGEEVYMIRPDIRAHTFGINYHHFFNYKEYSYRASFVQSEVQKKSAGSFILGINADYAFLEGDSSIIPDNVSYENFYQNRHFSKGSLLNVGAGFGYTHTFVIWKRFFISLSLNGGLSLGYTRLHKSEQNTVDYRIGYNANAAGRFAFGYNHNKWYVGFSSLNLILMNKAPGDKNWINVGAGNYRFNIARRIFLKKNVKLP
nr:DUF4421 family protein [Bacteroidota bacterium]